MSNVLYDDKNPDENVNELCSNCGRPLSEHMIKELAKCGLAEIRGERGDSSCSTAFSNSAVVSAWVSEASSDKKYISNPSSFLLIAALQ